MHLKLSQLRQAREWILGAFGHPEVWDRDVIPTMTDTQIELAITRHYDGGIPGFIRFCGPAAAEDEACTHRTGDGASTAEDDIDFAAGGRYPHCGCTLGTDGYWYIDADQAPQ